MVNEQFKDLFDKLPPIVPRTHIEDHLPGLISKGYLQNLDSEGKGPKRITIGRRVGYRREDLIEWLQSRSS